MRACGPASWREAEDGAIAAWLTPCRQMGTVEPLTAEDPPDLTGLRAPIRLLEDPQLVLSRELAAPRLGHHLRIRGQRAHASGLGRGGSSLRSSLPTAAASTPLQITSSLRPIMLLHLPPPSVILKVAGVPPM